MIFIFVLLKKEELMVFGGGRLYGKEKKVFV